MKLIILSRLWVLVLLMLFPVAVAQAAQPEQSNAETAQAAQPAEEQSIFSGLKPTEGPTKVKLGTEGQLEVPAGHVFLGPQDTQTLLKRMENLPAGDELGLIAPEDFAWFAVFSYDPSGYVEDTGDNAKIDSDGILKSYKDSMVESNKEKKARGWDTSSVVGWAVQPHYNKSTNNLEWAMRFKADGDGHEYDNYNLRILGREGIMEVIVAGDSDEESLKAVRPVLAGYSFVDGRTHAEFRQGDKLAGYGLAAVIGGGVAAAAVKSGFFAKFLKPILLGGAALVAGLFKFFRRGKKEE